MGKRRDFKDAPKRAQLQSDILMAGREMGAHTVFFHEAVAATLKLNATEMKLFDLIVRASNGVMTAGELAREAMLTTGAISQILSRLEGAGLVERFRDEKLDRRKVFVRAIPSALASLAPFYIGLEKRLRQLLEPLDPVELEVLLQFLNGASLALAAETAELRAASVSR